MLMAKPRSVSGLTASRLSIAWYSSSPSSLINIWSMLVSLSGKGYGLGEEILDQAGEPAGVFDLGPVAAVAVDVQLGVGDPVGQGQRSLQRDDLVFAAMHHQGRVGQRADRPLVAAQRLDPALARGREHGGEGFLEARADAGMVTQFGQVVTDQAAIAGERSSSARMLACDGL